MLVAICVCLLQASVEAGRQCALSEKIVRFHIIASSDADDDQALKMRVRDAVMPELEKILAGADSVEEAERRIDGNRESILSAALSASEGECVSLLFGQENYSFRQTEYYALPAGEYSSLRLVIGEGKGHNWWGVIFPQLDAASGYAEAMKLLDDDELRLILEEDGFELRFRFLEVLEELLDWIEKQI